jgi:drug/metabolite transporter (DMT)-like permease
MSQTQPVSFWTPRIFGPFLLVSLIWGSTWLVIRDQIGTVAPSWSVTWRFVLAAAGMFVFAALKRQRLAIPGRVQLLAMIFGMLQFGLNFQFVYRAEHFLTSGIVAVLFALLLVPNAILGRIFLAQPITRVFFGGTVLALVGIVLLLLHEYRIAPPTGQVLFGVALTLCAILTASASNVLQATAGPRSVPMLTFLAWGLVWGAVFDAAVALVLAGPPQFDWRWTYGAGVAYLALVGSVVTFPIYFGLVRELGAGRAAYNGVVVPIIAMLLSTLFEGYRWSLLAGTGAVLALGGLVLALRARNPSTKEG